MNIDMLFSYINNLKKKERQIFVHYTEMELFNATTNNQYNIPYLILIIEYSVNKYYLL